MDVSVLEAGHDESSPRLDDLGLRPPPVREGVLVRANPRDPLVDDGDSRGGVGGPLAGFRSPGSRLARAVSAEDATADNQEIGIHRQVRAAKAASTEAERPSFTAGHSSSVMLK
jgi:hypothetical protein